MLKQLYVHKNLLLFHAVVCHFLVNDRGGRGLKEKITKCDMTEKGVKKRYFASDALIE